MSSRNKSRHTGRKKTRPCPILFERAEAQLIDRRQLIEFQCSATGECWSKHRVMPSVGQVVQNRRVRYRIVAVEPGSVFEARVAVVRVAPEPPGSLVT